MRRFIHQPTISFALRRVKQVRLYGFPISVFGTALRSGGRGEEVEGGECRLGSVSDGDKFQIQSFHRRAFQVQIPCADSKPAGDSLRRMDRDGILALDGDWGAPLVYLARARRVIRVLVCHRSYLIFFNIRCVFPQAIDPRCYHVRSIFL